MIRVEKRTLITLELTEDDTERLLTDLRSLAYPGVVAKSLTELLENNES